MEQRGRQQESAIERIAGATMRYAQFIVLAVLSATACVYVPPA